MYGYGEWEWGWEEWEVELATASARRYAALYNTVRYCRSRGNVGGVVACVSPSQVPSCSRGLELWTRIVVKREG